MCLILFVSLIKYNNYKLKTRDNSVVYERQNSTGSQALLTNVIHSTVIRRMSQRGGEVLEKTIVLSVLRFTSLAHLDFSKGRLQSFEIISPRCRFKCEGYTKKKTFKI